MAPPTAPTQPEMNAVDDDLMTRRPTPVVPSSPEALEACRAFRKAASIARSITPGSGSYRLTDRTEEVLTPSKRLAQGLLDAKRRLGKKVLP